jgi:hypothetical protein
MNEASFWTAVRRRLPIGCRAWRIENGLSAGTPDVFACWQGISFWIELKYRPVEPRLSTIPFNKQTGINPNQKVFWIEYLGCGGRGLLLCGVARKHFLLPMNEIVLDGFNRWTWAELQKEALLLRDPDTWQRAMGFR